MRAVIVGGRSRADYLMGALADVADEIVAINSDRGFCEYLSSRHDNEVIWGDGTSRSVLEDAGVEGFDVVVALTGCDADNLAICQVTRQFLGIRRQLCIVANPENVRVFRQLGVTAAISGTAALAQGIRDALAEVPANGAPGPAGDGAARDGLGEARPLLGSWHLLGKDRG
ncbi:potassium channel family protein [Adlercreutzia faecimuris]|uniref:NAD-binding protein n=1 Tax=Adlercreutzia faecimuris TaxID=2897341 RepID=A0ABS9WGY6_9ACTN|nr:NAD-binding protein [Adlercreutzia sp. JBNU-10]MCI2242128.1 NAD-binding protein [Adlercreutzia sp. JBNU-10]